MVWETWKKIWLYSKFFIFNPKNYDILKSSTNIIISRTHKKSNNSSTAKWIKHVKFGKILNYTNMNFIDYIQLLNTQIYFEF
mgnify:CR=1 FL=1